MAAISITVTDVTPGADGPRGHGISGGTISAGAPVYQDADDNNTYKMALGSTAAKARVKGLALAATFDGQPIAFVKSGTLNISDVVTAGTVYVLSATATGGIVTATHSASGDYITVLGVATASNVLAVHIHATETAKA